MPGKQVTELDALPSFTDTSLLPVHNGAGLKKGLLSQLANYLGNKFSNPNLLINPDFKINQRGAISYEQQGYSVDRWKIWNVTVTPSASGGITVKNDKYEDTGTFIQILENATEGDSTLSCYVTSVSGTVTMVADDGSQVILKQGLNVVHTSSSTKNFTIFLNQGTSITLKWVKLEQGSIATSFVEPNISDELDKCLRYFESGSLDTAPGLAIQPTVYIRTYIHPKRSNPTYKFSGSVSFEMNGTGKNLSLTHIGADLNTECCTFRFKPSETTQYGLGFCKNFAYEIDAEIY
ncbi:MAG: hypothetical protein ACLT8P_06650 [Holdemanella porci]|uniref:hypothetical protein n=1 Tax=Holdemanella porci TaxID=2652276 RepID=UPI003994230B